MYLHSSLHYILQVPYWKPLEDFSLPLNTRICLVRENEHLENIWWIFCQRSTSWNWTKETIFLLGECSSITTQNIYGWMQNSPLPFQFTDEITLSNFLDFSYHPSIHSFIYHNPCLEYQSWVLFREGQWHLWCLHFGSIYNPTRPETLIFSSNTAGISVPWEILFPHPVVPKTGYSNPMCIG